MKPNRSLSDIAAQVLSREARDAPEVAPKARARTIDAIARAMHERKQRQQRLRWGAVGAAAMAASIAFAVGLGRSSHRTDGEMASGASPSASPMPAISASFVRGFPVVVRQGVRHSLSNGSPIHEGDRVLVDLGSRTTVALANGTYLVVDDRADLLLVSAAPATTFELASGSVHADVAKLTPDERFVIRTSDAEIEVHGTSFDVSRATPDPSCGNGTTTRVRVREGIVAVRAAGAETFVRANETWPSGCSVTANAPPVDAPIAPTAPSTTAPPVAGFVTQPTKRTPEAPASTLAAQNDMFERAVARKRAGDVPGAISGFDDFLGRYPTSHLAQSARAERMTLLRGVDRERARAAARAYLERHPDGFARRDAELILSSE